MSKQNLKNDAVFYESLIYDISKIIKKNIKKYNN